MQDTEGIKMLRTVVLCLIAGAAGFAYAAVTLFLAWGMTGAGEGWMSPCSCILGLAVVPIAAVGIALRAAVAGKILTLVGLAIDGLIFTQSLNEGINYAQRTWRFLPFVMVAWVALWLLWQITALLSLAWPSRRQTGRAFPLDIPTASSSTTPAGEDSFMRP